jgi:hypothetical protein
MTWVHQARALVTEPLTPELEEMLHLAALVEADAEAALAEATS